MLHNVELANPLAPTVRLIKQYSKKRTKTDEDHLVLSQLEWLGGLYLSDPLEDIEISNDQVVPVGGGQIILPSHGLEAAISSAAKKFKLGKTVAAAVMVPEDAVLKFPGDKQPISELMKSSRHVDVRAVSVNRARIMRSRPVFPNWSATFDLQYLPDQISLQQIDDVLSMGGRVVGCFEYRPKFGSYSHELLSA